jgi:protein-tyrosine phosphatase
LLDEKIQRPRYDRKAVADDGWGIYPIPVAEGEMPSLVQMCEFASLVGAASKATKILVFCDNGLGRSAFMGAVYWIAKGLSALEAISRVARSAGVDRIWSADEWHAALRRFEALQWRIP